MEGDFQAKRRVQREQLGHYNRSLSRADASKHVNPFRALLNINNTCPLELYHW